MSKFYIAGAVAVAAVTLAACTSSGSPSDARDKAGQNNKNLQNQVYVQKNNIEFNNYNDRQRVADQPATILWCTVYPNNPNVKPFTVPIVGKLTSSSKRPYATERVSNADSYYPEVAGPDSMYGSSAEYRYGFTPGHVYADFTDLPTFCTTEPTVYQATQTAVVLKVDPVLSAAAQQAQNALQAGKRTPGSSANSNDKQAQIILQNALGGK